MSFICGEYNYMGPVPLENLANMIEIGQIIEPKANLMSKCYDNTCLGYGIVDNSWETAVASNKNYIVMFDGIIYNIDEIILKYNIEQTRSCSELVLDLLARISEKDLNKYLKGDFVYCIISLKDDKLTLGRSLFGLRPLFYFHNENCIAWASNLEQLARNYGKVTDVSLKEYIAEYLCIQQHGRLSVTPLNNTSAVLPGQVIVIKRNKKYIYESLHPVDRGTIEIPFNEASITLNKMIYRSVERRLRYPKTGLMLSGGLDSSTIAKSIYDIGLVSNLPEIELIHFEYPGEVIDDILTKRLAFDLNMNLRVIKIEDVAAFNLYNKQDSIVPRAKALNPKGPTYIGDFSIILTGLAGDQLFTGSPLNPYVIKKVNKYIKIDDGLFNDLTICFTKKLHIQARRKIRMLPRRFVRPDAELSFQRLIHGNQWVANNSFNNIVSPYFDMEMIEFVLSLPPEHRYSNGVGKLILRSAMSDIQYIMERQTKGNHSHVVNKGIIQNWDETLANSRQSILEKMNILERGTLEKYIYRLREGTVFNLLYIFQLFELESWVNSIVDGENIWLG